MPGFGTPVKTPASLSTAAGLNLPHGTAPTSPVNGDVWTTATGLFVRVNGTTIGPLSSAAAAAFRKATLSACRPRVITDGGEGYVGIPDFYYADVAQTVSYLILSKPAAIFKNGNAVVMAGAANSTGSITLAQGDLIEINATADGDYTQVQFTQTA